MQFVRGAVQSRSISVILRIDCPTRSYGAVDTGSDIAEDGLHHFGEIRWIFAFVNSRLASQYVWGTFCFTDAKVHLIL